MSPSPAERDQVDFISGKTRLLAILGDPIVQVRSPEMVTAELHRRGIDAIVVPLNVLPERFDAAVGELKAIANLDGLIFTIPYKGRAVSHADRLGRQGEVNGAINALTRAADGRWVGDMFDGIGCVEAFRRRGHAIAGRRVGLVGAGGAGGAVGIAIAAEAPAALTIQELDAGRAEALAARVRVIAPKVAVGIGRLDPERLDILLNVSPVGMLEDRRLPVDCDRLPSRLIVFDAVVKPEVTPLLALAEACGCPIVQGREMMRGQISRIVDFFRDATRMA